MYNCIIQQGPCFHHGGYGCNCHNEVRNKVGNCHCGAPVYEISQLYWQHQWSLYCPKPRIEYTCTCRYNQQVCVPVVPLKITVEYQQPARKLSKKRSGKEW